MSSFRFDAETTENIELAIDNEWSLRPTGSSGFVNIEHQKKIKLSDKSHILNDISDLDKFPNSVTSLALIAKHLDINFVCLDFDFKEDDLKQKVWNKLLSKYQLEDLFLRIGNNDKIGQVWFQTESLLKHRGAKNFDVIVHDKRCNAIGYYKDTQQLFEWPYKKFWEHTPDDLPFISEGLIDEIIELIQSYYGVEYKKDAPLGSRHEIVKQKIFDRMNKPAFLNIIQDIIKSPEYISALAERDFKGETQRLLEWGVSTVFENYNDISGFFDDEEEDFFKDFNIDHFPKVEKNSFIDIVYKATKRNQYTDNKTIAFFTSLSIASWLLTFSTRFEGMSPNLMILIIAYSGSGKSTSSRAIKELIKLYREFQPSYMGNDIKTEASLLNNLEDAPNPYYIIDEFTKIFRSRNSKNSQVGNITEILCQLYSDYSDTDLHQVKLKTHSYGVCYGPKMNLLAFSTPEFWKMFSESDIAQGLGRRTIIVNDDTVSFAKKNVEYNKNFFKPEELQIIKMFMDRYVKSLFLYTSEDVRGYQIKKGIDKQGEDIFWEDAVKMNPHNDLKATDEVSTYLKTTFIDKCNQLKKRALQSGNNLDLFVVASMPELVRKFAIIHAIAGKAIFEKDDNGNLVIATRTHIDMKSIDWAEKMFLFYVVNGISVDFENIFNKDKESSNIISIGDALIDALLSENIKEFTRSNNTYKNYFRNADKCNRNEVLNNLIHRGKVEAITKGGTKRGGKFRIIEAFDDN